MAGRSAANSGCNVALTEIDRDLLDRCVENAPGAWNDFVDRFYGLFVHVARHTAHSRSIRLDSADIDDLCADVFLTVLADGFRVLKAFEGRSSLATYLTVVARRVVVRSLSERRMAEALGHVSAHGESINRAMGGERPVADRGAVDRNGLSGDRPNPGRPASENPDVKRVDDRDEVSRMLRGLGERDARIVREYHIEGRTYGEIAARTGVPENSIGPTLSRARTQLRSREAAR
jgi:RNA polymerase sigma-70 factor, ECF subfamily